MAVMANGLVIGITSDFIPRLVYRYYYGPCANGTSANLEWVLLLTCFGIFHELNNLKKSISYLFEPVVFSQVVCFIIRYQ